MLSGDWRSIIREEVKVGVREAVQGTGATKGFSSVGSAEAESLLHELGLVEVNEHIRL